MDMAGVVMLIDEYEERRNVKRHETEAALVLARIVSSVALLLLLFDEQFQDFLPLSFVFCRF